MEIGQVGGERAFDGFIVAEYAVELLRQRQWPIRGVRQKLDQGAQTVARGFRCVVALREPVHDADDVLHLAEQLIDAGAGLREALGQRTPRGVEIVGHQERLIERAAARLVKRAGRNPFDGVDHAGTRQHVMFGIARVVRVAGLVQRSLDKELAGFVARRRTADRIAALDHQHLAAGARQDRSGGEAAKAGADNHDIITCHSA